jgi:Snare region anchored in the vesicle membrane C-terminus
MSSHRAMDEIIAQAAETREALSRQRSSLTNAMSGVSSLMGNLPGVGQLVGAIHSRRLLNDRTMAIVAAVCLCFFLWWFALRNA